MQINCCLSTLSSSFSERSKAGSKMVRNAIPSLSSSSSGARDIGSIAVARNPRWVYKVSLLQRQVSCRNATVSPLIHSRRGERIAIVPQRGQAGNVCSIETGNHRNSQSYSVT